MRKSNLQLTYIDRLTEMFLFEIMFYDLRFILFILFIYSLFIVNLQLMK